MSSARSLLAAWSGSPSLKMVVGWPHRIGVLAQVCRSASHSFAFEIEVVVGGTHLEFNFVASLKTSMCMSTATLESTVREGLMHLVVFG